MTPLLHTAVLVAATSSKGKGGGSSYFPLLIIVVLFGGLYLLVLRPRNKARRQQQVKARDLEIGSEVMSVGGIMGTIVGMSDTTFDVSVADGVVLTFVRRAINARPDTAGPTTTEDMPPDPWDAPPEDFEPPDTVDEPGDEGGELPGRG